MIKVDTGCKTIFRYDNLLDNETCSKLYDYITSIKSTPTDNTIMPWFEKNSFQWMEIKDKSLKKKIYEYRETLKKLVNEVYNKNYYIDFTDIVLWHKHKSMPLHNDDGNEKMKVLNRRKVTTVTYINDNFEGGETFIKNETGKDYISKPKTGSVVILLSDTTNLHGVNEVLSGLRLTLPIWFCEEAEYSENNRFKNLIKELI